MRVECCSLYLWYKIRPVIKVLTNLAGEPVNNVTGVLTHCSGTWNDPGKCRQFAGTLYFIHVANKQNELYCKVGDKCNDLPVIERHKGCKNHTGSPLLLPSGSPQTDLKLIKTSEHFLNELSGHMSQACAQFCLAMSARSKHVLNLAVHCLICKLQVQSWFPFVCFSVLMTWMVW